MTGGMEQSGLAKSFLFLIECQGTERSLNAPRRAAHDAGVEVSGSAVSVPRVESPTKGKRIAAPISVAPISKVLSGCA